MWSKKKGETKLLDDVDLFRLIFAGLQGCSRKNVETTKLYTCTDFMFDDGVVDIFTKQVELSKKLGVIDEYNLEVATPFDILEDPLNISSGTPIMKNYHFTITNPNKPRIERLIPTVRSQGSPILLNGYAVPEKVDPAEYYSAMIEALAFLSLSRAQTGKRL